MSGHPQLPIAAVGDKQRLSPIARPAMVAHRCVATFALRQYYVRIPEHTLLNVPAQGESSHENESTVARQGWRGDAVRFLFASAAFATSYGTDATDLWGNANESGWGIQFIQQDGVIFATMYVYDSAGNATWYIATLTAADRVHFTGDLIQTRGPWFGAPIFNPATATLRKVGTMTFTFTYVESGTLVYSVDGVTVSKAIRRTTFKTDDYAGHFLGAYRFVATQCNNAAYNGVYLAAATISATQAANSLRVIINSSIAGTCTFNGNYQQDGQFGKSSGTYSCTSGESGSYTFFEMAVSWYNVRGRYTAHNNFGCSLEGTFAGLQDQ